MKDQYIAMNVYYVKSFVKTLGSILLTIQEP